jgi:hypothetical protein
MGTSLVAFNAGPGSVIRLYHDTDFFGAWVCIPNRTWIYNLNNYRFNNGTRADGSHRSGFGLRVAGHFKSIGVSYGKCSNPA